MNQNSNAEILRLRQKIKSLEESIEEKDKALNVAVKMCDNCIEHEFNEAEIDGLYYDVEHLRQYFKETKKLP